MSYPTSIKFEAGEAVVWADAQPGEPTGGYHPRSEHGEGPFTVTCVIDNEHPDGCCCGATEPDHGPTDECGPVPARWLQIQNPDGSIITEGVPCPDRAASFDSSWFKKV